MKGEFLLYTVVVIGFNPTEYNVSEGAGVVTLMTERRGATAQPLAVNISTNDFASTGMHSPSPFMQHLYLCIDYVTDT